MFCDVSSFRGDDEKAIAKDRIAVRYFGGAYLLATVAIMVLSLRA
jgi:hypothetical protein